MVDHGGSWCPLWAKPQGKACPPLGVRHTARRPTGPQTVWSEGGGSGRGAWPARQRRPRRKRRGRWPAPAQGPWRQQSQASAQLPYRQSRLPLHQADILADRETKTWQSGFKPNGGQVAASWFITAWWMHEETILYWTAFSAVSQ